jgi:carbon monoxide dehydrogenase subunit G
VLIKLSEDLSLDAPPEEVWKLLRDTPRFASFLPGVEGVERVERVERSNKDAAEEYTAKVSEKVGPFKVTLNLAVSITETIEPALLKAAIKGADSLGLNRITGSLQVALRPSPAGTEMRFEASIEVLGKLATLGAVPIRHRTTESFAAFARNIQGQFAKEQS